MRKKILTLTLTFLLSSCEAKREELIIFYASSLSLLAKDLASEFSKIYPQLKLSLEAGGSRELAYKVSDLKRPADILMLADYRIFKDLLVPEYIDWYIKFARSRLVIVFTEQSLFGDKINEDNWYRILSHKDVRFGRTNPDTAPLGYYTLLLWQLADIYYQDKIDGKSIYTALYENSLPENIYPEEAELLLPLKSFNLDYAFSYISFAKQHNLKFITLPEEIDLSNPEFSDRYKQAKVMVSGKRPGEFLTIYGEPIVYGLAIPKESPNYKMAIEFLKFVLSEKGKRIIEKNHFLCISPAIASDVKAIPSQIKIFCK